jgi:hypothetical protein
LNEKDVGPSQRDLQKGTQRKEGMSLALLNQSPQGSNPLGSRLPMH